MRTGAMLGKLAIVGFLVGSMVKSWAAELPGKEYRISGVVVSVRDGSPVPYCRLSAFAVSSSATTIAGGVSGAAGFAGPGMGGRMGGAVVAQRSPTAPGQAPETTADESGRFSLAVPRAGSWRLSASARGFRSQNFDEHEGFFSAVVLSEATPTLAVRFRLTPNAVLTGFILDDAGEPVESAQVTAELIPVQGLTDSVRPRSAGTVQTDDRGRYEIGGLAPGQYRLRVQAQPWYSTRGRVQFQARGNQAGQQSSVPSPDPSLDFVYPMTWFPGVDDESAAEEIKLSPGEEHQADFRLTAIPSVHLRVPRPPDPVSNPGDQRGRPQPQRTVTIQRVGGNPGLGMQQFMPSLGPGNDWDFGGLSPGTYEIRIPGQDGRTSEIRRIEVKAGSSCILDLDGSKSLIPVLLKVDGIPNSQATSLEFVDTETGERISSMANFRGRGGFQRPNQDGDTEPADDDEPATRTVMLEPHTYQIYLTSGPAVYLTGIDATGAKVSGRTISVAGPATLTLHLANQHAQLDGIASAGGGPAAGAMVLLVPATFGSTGALTEIERAETNTDGSFRLSAVLPGPYILVVIDHGWSVDWRNPATLGQYLLRGKPVNLPANAKDHEELEAVPAN